MTGRPAAAAWRGIGRARAGVSRVELKHTNQKYHTFKATTRTTHAPTRTLTLIRPRILRPTAMTTHTTKTRNDHAHGGHRNSQSHRHATASGAATATAETAKTTTTATADAGMAKAPAPDPATSHTPRPQRRSHSQSPGSYRGHQPRLFLRGTFPPSIYLRNIFIIY